MPYQQSTIIEQRHSLDVKYIVASIFIVFLSWIIHETAHWAVGVLLGYDAIMTLNSTSLNSSDPSQTHKFLVTDAGPLVTVLIALGTFLFLRFKAWNRYIYLVLFTSFYMRFLASGMNVINTNDEGKISEWLGLGVFTVPGLISLLLFYLVYNISRRYALTVKFNNYTLFLIMLFSSFLILLDMFVRVKLLPF